MTTQVDSVVQEEAIAEEILQDIQSGMKAGAIQAQETVLDTVQSYFETLEKESKDALESYASTPKDKQTLEMNSRAKVALVNLMNTEQVKTQEELFQFMLANKIDYLYSSDVGPLRREFRKFEHVLRANKIKGITIDGTLDILEKYSKVNYCKEVTNFLYYFFKYANQLNKEKRVLNYLVYLRFTVIFLNAALQTGKVFPVVSKFSEECKK